MLQRLFGKVGGRALVFLRLNEDGYASELSRTLGLSLSAVQGQLMRFERAGILASRQRGKTRLYSFDPRSPYYAQMTALVDRAVGFLSDEERRNLAVRRKPRRAGKP